MRSRTFIPLFVAAFCVSLMQAQEPPRLRGPLVVWVVLSPGPVAPRRIAAAPLQGSMPDQTAGSYGQTNGSFGQTAGSYGQTSGSYGQTLAGFGTSLDDLPAAAARANGSLPAPLPKPVRSAALERYVRESERWQGVPVTFVDVPANELEAKLAGGGSGMPDVLMGLPLPAGWSRADTGLVRRYGLVTLTGTSFEEQSEEAAPPPVARAELNILKAAPHPETARAFVRWYLLGKQCDRCAPAKGEAAEAVAAGSATLRDVLQGVRPAGVDADFARAEPRATQALALGTDEPLLLEDLGVRIDVLSARANERFAVLELNATLESHAAFGVLQALVVLRKDALGKWRTLQVTPSLQSGQLARASGALNDYARPVRLELVGKPLGISQVAPSDGDLRSVQPYLGWENFGGATLQVVESQARADWAPSGGWLGSNLFYIPDTNQHLRTQVAGRFASHVGDFRWRIWSLGNGGALTLSPWRSLRVVTR